MELKNYSTEMLFTEIDRYLMVENRPSEYLEIISNEPLFKKQPFDKLYAMKETGQNPIYHPEGNVWNHTKMVVDEAASVRERSKEPRVFMWAALLHDIGKPPTTAMRKGKLTSYDHDRVGEQLALSFLQQYFTDEEFIDKICGLVRWHMQVLFVVKQRNVSSIRKMAERVDIREIALLGLCDRLGRTNADRHYEHKSIQRFLKICSEVIGEEIFDDFLFYETL